MEASFEAKSVGTEHLRMAYAVMLLSVPELSFPDFKKWALNCRHGRLSGIFDRRGYIHGIFRNRVESRPGHIDRFIVFDLILSDALSSTMTSMMLEALVHAARLNGCDQMTIETPSKPRIGNKLVEMLANSGFVDESVRMARRV